MALVQRPFDLTNDEHSTGSGRPQKGSQEFTLFCQVHVLTFAPTYSGSIRVSLHEATRELAGPDPGDTPISCAVPARLIA